MVHKVLIQCFVFLSSALSAVINYHDVQYRPSRTGICVANHTSPIDVLVLMCDYCYSLVSTTCAQRTELWTIPDYHLLFFCWTLTRLTLQRSTFLRFSFFTFGTRIFTLHYQNISLIQLYQFASLHEYHLCLLCYCYVMLLQPFFTLSLTLCIWCLWCCAINDANEFIFRFSINLLLFFATLDRSTTWWFPWRTTTRPCASITAHLVRTGRIQRSNGRCTAFASTRIGSEQSTNTHIPGGHMHQ